MAAKRESLDLWTRREAVERVSLLFGGVALVGQTRLLEALAHPQSEPSVSVLGAADVVLLDEVADTILPETSTPGAKAAGVGPFMALMVADVYDPEEQRIFTEGLRSLDRESTTMHGHGFLAAEAGERLSLLERLDREQYEYMLERGRRAEANSEIDEPVHYFRMMKELALLGYFTSEIGYRQAMRFAETPGRYEPCVPYKPGDKAWAEHA